MRNELRIAGLLGAILLTVSASGQTAPNTPASAVPILQGTALPMYPPIAKAAHVTGKVVVRVTVKDGLMVQTEVLSKPAVASGGRLLESPTLENLKTWRFAADVTGAFTVTYTYEISGTETEEPTNAKVEMLPSLDVKITARPVKPTVMYQKQSSPAADTSPHSMAVDNATHPSCPSGASCGVVVPLGLQWSTGRTIPTNLNEQLAMDEVMSNPQGEPAKGMTMSDPRWPASQGWVKMQQIVNGVVIHFVKNTVTGAFDDFKFK